MKKLLEMRYFFTLIAVCISFLSFSQDSETTETAKVGRPNIPGTMQVDFGYSFVPGTEYFRVIGSRTLNLYYYRDIRISDSKFSFHPGIGLGLDRYRFADSLGFVLQIANTPDSSYFRAVKEFQVRKSQLISTYVDIPIEFRFSTNPSDPARSFNVSVGGKVGYLLRGTGKLKYNEDDEIKKLKDIQKFHMSDIRYGAYLRVGTGGFNVFTNYMISPLFTDGEGHMKETMNSWTIGISVVGF